VYLEKRKAYSSAELEEASNRIAELFKGIPLESVGYLHIFYPMLGKFEVDTLKIAGWVKETHPEIELVLSKSDVVNHTLTHYIWDEETKLTVNQWGITEPVQGREIDPLLLDMILVPLLVVDKRGNRVGYGKGFYDRFFGNCKPDVAKIGLSLFEPVDLITDTNEFDVPIDICITPDRVWNFKST
jgi:5-formyltetrahydrofolate cyclo-ligase